MRDPRGNEETGCLLRRLGCVIVVANGRRVASHNCNYRRNAITVCYRGGLSDKSRGASNGFSAAIGSRDVDGGL